MLSRLGLALLVLSAFGCATASFKVPASEIERLVELPPKERGREVRIIPSVIPASAPTAAPDDAMVVEGPAPAPQPVLVNDMYISVDGPGRPISHGHHYQPVNRPSFVATHTGGSGFSGTPIPVSAPARTGWSGTPRPAPAPRVPSGVHHGGGGGHHGGSGGANAAVAGAVAVVAIVGLVAVLASVAADSEARAEFARTYDGWVTVDPGQIVHLRYKNGSGRDVRLSDLTARDTEDLRFGVLKDIDGKVVPLAAPTGLPAPPSVGPGAALPPDPPRPLPAPTAPSAPPTPSRATPPAPAPATADPRAFPPPVS